MYHAALHRFPTHILDSSQVFEKWILQKQPKIFNNILKGWDKNTIKDLEQVCPNKQTGPHFSLLIVVFKDIFT